VKHSPNRRRLVIRLAELSLLCLLILIAAAHILCSGTLRVPRRTYHLSDWQPIETTARDGAILRGWFTARSTPPYDCVLVLHGINDTAKSAAGFAPTFLDAGYAVAIPDARGHGRSEGELITYGVLERHDVLAWARTLRARGCQRLYALGESLGAAVLIQAAAVEPAAFHAIAAESAYADLRTVGEYRVRKFARLPAPIVSVLVASSIHYARLRYGLDLNQASPVDAIGRTTTPILLIHGMADDLTPPSHSESLSRANPRAQVWLVPRAGHVQASAVAAREFRERVLEWFAAHR
jgi:alpha-beta hydrolase superfamily lysophospholipase